MWKSSDDQTIKMRSFEGMPAASTTSAGSTNTIPENNNTKTNTVSNQDERLNTDQTATFTTPDSQTRQSEELYNSLAETIGTQVSTTLLNRSTSESSPEIAAGYQDRSTRPKSVEFGHDEAHVQRRITQARQGSLDSAFASQMFPQHMQDRSPPRRKLQYSASWPIQNNNDKPMMTAYFPHGVHHRKGYDQYQTTDVTGASGSRTSRQHLQHLELSRTSSERPLPTDATSPTHEIAQALYHTRLQSPPSYEQYLHQSGESSNRPLSQQVTSSNVHFPSIFEGAYSLPEHGRQLNRGQFVQTTAQFNGARKPTSEQYFVTGSDFNPQTLSADTPPFSSVNNARPPWHGMASATAYPHYQSRREGPMVAYNPHQRAIMTGEYNYLFHHCIKMDMQGSIIIGKSVKGI